MWTGSDSSGCVESDGEITFVITETETHARIALASEEYSVLRISYLDDEVFLNLTMSRRNLIEALCNFT